MPRTRAVKFATTDAVNAKEMKERFGAAMVWDDALKDIDPEAWHDFRAEHEALAWAINAGPTHPHWSLPTTLIELSQLRKLLYDRDWKP